MNIREAYNSWSVTYDSVFNKTRDLEGKALRDILTKLDFDSVLEIGCGTGKNTAFFIETGKHVTAVDFSEEMLAVARSKYTNSSVNFVHADVICSWSFSDQQFDLVTFSLVLEHIGNIDEIFFKAAAHVTKGGYVYLGELHPFRQYQGSKARFESGDAVFQLECYTHHVSEFFGAGVRAGLKCVLLKDYFDEDEKNLPRILTMVFEKI